MNLADPSLELVDPTPNIYMLFTRFDNLFFWTKLVSRAVVRWSKRMYSCAGTCSYEGRGGICDIALSEPLLKLRPRKDLVETLLHEMIHAFLFVTNKDQDRDGHGPNFQYHMHRINKCAGLNISIYHDFHDEVELYQVHWWRCNGSCRAAGPHFGTVRRPINRAPGPSDSWWTQHMRRCGGTFVKIKEPDNFNSRQSRREAVIKSITKTYGDISKYMPNNINTISNSKNFVTNSSNTRIKSNSSRTIIVSKKGVVYNPTVPKSPSQPVLFTGNGYSINNNNNLPDYKYVTEHVRNIWAKKDIPIVINKSPLSNLTKPTGITNPNKHKAENTSKLSPPAKMKKIDDYFKANATLNDLYGQDFKLTPGKNSNKLVAVKEPQVSCPICKSKVNRKDINNHLDECLNKDIIDKLKEDDQVADIKPSQNQSAEESKQDKNDDLFGVLYVDSRKETKKTDKPEASQSESINNVKISSKSPQTAQSSGNITAKATGDKVCKLVKKYQRLPEKPTIKIETDKVVVKSEPGTSVNSEVFGQICPCCGNNFDKTVDEHLDECLVFFKNNNTIPTESANSSVVVIDDDDDIFDESQVFNPTGTKLPCPCCMKMVEEADMNDHLDICLAL